MLVLQHCCVYALLFSPLFISADASGEWRESVPGYPRGGGCCVLLSFGLCILTDAVSPLAPGGLEVDWTRVAIGGWTAGGLEMLASEISRCIKPCVHTTWEASIPCTSPALHRGHQSGRRTAGQTSSFQQDHPLIRSPRPHVVTCTHDEGIKDGHNRLSGLINAVTTGISQREKRSACSSSSLFYALLADWQSFRGSRHSFHSVGILLLILIILLSRSEGRARR